jgi:uncharacterized protein YndB with AHSA1/START domain
MSSGNGLVLYHERSLPAPRTAIYRAITDAIELSKWWGPKGFTTPCATFDPKVGAGYRIAMQPPTAISFTCPASSGKSRPAV